MTTAPSILALDFDGVLCDGLIEYFQTAWQAYCQLFAVEDQTPPVGLAERFYPLRPVIETGWEMPLLLHALQTGAADQAVLAGWPSLVRTIVQETQIPPAKAMAAVDGVRDRWIQTDLENWLSLHRFYPGVIAWLQRAIATGVYPIIISTKEGRFIQALLAQAGLTLPREQIIGKEIQQPKTQTLWQLLQSPPPGTDPTNLWFIEDRLKTLEKVKAAPDLTGVKLFLADWGYNTTLEKEQAQRDERIHLLSLSQLVREFSNWPGAAAR
jgi:phosphoglycolate phosphatase-like HAD superfamily hydrolase